MTERYYVIDSKKEAKHLRFLAAYTDGGYVGYDSLEDAVEAADDWDTIVTVVE